MNALYVISSVAAGLVLLIGFPLLLLYWMARSVLLMHGEPTVIDATLDRDYRAFFHLFALKS